MIFVPRALSQLNRTAASSPRATLSALSGCSRFFASSQPASSSSEGKQLTRQDVLDSDGLLQFKTLHEMNYYASIAFKENPLFGTYKAPEVEDNVVKDPSGALGTFEWMSYGEYGEMVEKCRAVLKDIGIREYSKIGIISNNRWEWAALAAAAYSLNAAIVPMYETQLPKDWTYILNDSECSALFCSKGSSPQHTFCG